MAWLAKELQMQPEVAIVRMKYIHITIDFIYVFFVEVTNIITAGSFIEDVLHNTC